MKIAFYGSSLLSSYWNGAATYYRGLLKALAAKGYEITFYEPDAFGRQDYCDIDPPDWARVVVYPATPAGVDEVTARASETDIVVKASGVGHADDLLLKRLMERAASHALRIFWDVDAPATLAELSTAPDHPMHRALPELDMVLTYGGGDAVVATYRALGAHACVPIYNALDPETHFPVQKQDRFVADLAFLGNRLPDREARIGEFFLYPASDLPGLSFLLGGAGWEALSLPANVTHIGHVGTADHNAFNCGPRAVLNVSRDSMAEVGFSPATRVFEAAGAGACLITDQWEGIERFLRPGSEILVARDGSDVREILDNLSEERALAIGQAALARVLAEHCYEHRAQEAHECFRRAAEARRMLAK